MNKVRLSDIIAPAFRKVHRDIKKHGHTHYWNKGGRGSTKSSFISIEVPLLLKHHPDCHAVILRKIGNTLRNNVFTSYDHRLFFVLRLTK